ncbi:MAG: FUSC family protein [Microbacteriaceae bacterium]
MKPKLHWSLKESWQRTFESLAPIAQIVLGATIGYAVAHFGLGHAYPLLAVTVTITALGFSRDARPRRVLETATGMVVGIALSEVLLQVFSQGIWQIAATLAICLISARFISGSATFALTVGLQAMLVQILPAPDGGVFVRSIDGLIGGLTALAVTALIPRDPRGLARTDAHKLFDVFLEALEALKLALRDVDLEVADDTLRRVRRTQPLVDNWRLSLDSAISIAKISPFLRKYRDELRGQVRLMRGMDLATRNLRVVVRRVDFLIRDRQPRPYLADLMEQIADATRVLEKGLEEPELLDDAQEMLVAIIGQLDPKKHGIADQVREASVLLLLRPLLVDLLCASGMSEEDARAELPAI